MVQMEKIYKVLKDVIAKEVKKTTPNLQIFLVSDVSTKDDNGKVTEYKINIKHPNRKIQYNEVPVMGIGLGNLKGIITYPNEGDFVVVGWLGEQPIVLGTVNDIFTQSPDSIPEIKQNETILVGKEKGQFIYMNESGDILIKTPDGAKAKFNNDGSWKIFSADDYGIECDTSNDVKIYSNNVNTTSGAGGEKIPITDDSSGTW